MRVLHISDLHLGRDYAGFSRREEQERLVRELADAARQEDVDLTVIPGDVFDTVNPPAWAEDAFYALLDGLSEGGRRAVLVISGNHDQAIRLSASDPIASRLGIVLLGQKDDRPVAFDGTRGRVSIEPLGPGSAIIRSGDRQRAIGVGALPFLSEVSLVKRLTGEAAQGEAEDREAYGRALSALFHERYALLPRELPSMLVGHLWVSGGKESRSERLYRLSALADMPASAFPAADYVALGHLHRPQRVGNGTPIVYAGSPIAYSITEAGEQKRAVLAELLPGQPATWRDLPLTSGRPVEEWRVYNLDELRHRAEASRSTRPFVALTVDVGRPLARAERDELQKLGVDFVSVEVLATDPLMIPLAAPVEDDMSDEELVRSFLEHALDAPAEPALIKDVLRLLEEVEAEEAGTPAPSSEAA